MSQANSWPDAPCFETAARQIENMLFLALLLQNGQRQRERCDVRDMAHISGMRILFLGAHVFNRHPNLGIDAFDRFQCIGIARLAVANHDGQKPRARPPRDR